MLQTQFLDSLSIWNIFNADFISTTIVDSVIFENKSSNYEDLLWNFGDGNTSIIENPSHTYLNSGIYNISLVSSTNNDCLSDTASMSLSIYVPSNNQNCSDSLEITDLIIDNNSLTMNIAIYNGYDYFLNYPYVAYTLDANNDTLQNGNMNLFVAFSQDTTWYNYSISSPITPIYPLTSYFVYSGSNFSVDTCALTYSPTATTIFNYDGNNKKLIKIIDLLGRENEEKKNIPLLYIYSDGTVEKENNSGIESGVK